MAINCRTSSLVADIPCKPYKPIPMSWPFKSPLNWATFPAKAAQISAAPSVSLVISCSPYNALPIARDPNRAVDSETLTAANFSSFPSMGSKHSNDLIPYMNVDISLSDHILSQDFKVSIITLSGSIFLANLRVRALWKRIVIMWSPSMFLFVFVSKSFFWNLTSFVESPLWLLKKAMISFVTDFGVISGDHDLDPPSTVAPYNCRNTIL